MFQTPGYTPSKPHTDGPAAVKGTQPLTSSARLLQLQKAYGNQAVLQLMKKRIAPASAAPPIQLQDEEQEDLSTYTNTVKISREDGGNDQAVTADLITIGSIMFPGSYRPPTKTGAKQNAHSISWTLLKHSYAAAKGMDVETFLTSYAKVDWLSLDEQLKLLEKKNPDIRDEYVELNAYLERYDAAYMNSLIAASHPPLKWMELVQSLVTDLFVAIQLAPLTTHTGYNGDRPEYHGEGQSNKDFESFESYLKQKEPLLQDNSTRDAALLELRGHAKNVMKSAKRYWDLGADHPHGVQDPEEIKYLQAEFQKIFGRAFPLTQKYFQPAVQHVLEGKQEAAFDDNLIVVPNAADAENAPANVQNQPVNADNGMVVEKEVPQQDKFQVRMGMDSTSPFVQVLTAGELRLDHVKMSDDRVYTKYYRSGQKSHTVSWGLIRDSLIAEAKGKNMEEFLLLMLSKWEFLKNQDWTYLLTKPFLRGSHYEKDLRKQPQSETLVRHNQENQERLQDIHNKIEANILKAKASLVDVKMTELAWTSMLQNMISDYVVAYNSSPLASYADGAAVSNGEKDANTYLKLLEEHLGGNVEEEGAQEEEEEEVPDSVDPSMQIEEDNASEEEAEDVEELPDFYDSVWIPKFKNEFGKKKKKKVYRNKSSEKRTKELAKKLDSKKVLSEVEKNEAINILVRQQALKHLDVKKTAVATAPQEDQETYLAMIFFEWESAIKAKYPKIWETYNNLFRGHSEENSAKMGEVRTQYEPKHQASALDKEIWKTELYQRREYLEAAYQARRDPSYQPATPAAKLAKQDYEAGILDGRNGVRVLPRNPLIQNGARETGHRDYSSGMFASEKHAATPFVGVRAGVADYNRGFQEGQDPLVMRDGTETYGYLYGFDTARQVDNGLKRPAEEELDDEEYREIKIQKLDSEEEEF
ncbi:hypothetical protein [Tumebacillus flagellatus]|uniref:Uncharacterized protein n=1 Tax=Tumebacillus flagellatus TaxID=1157490 RepID=A0A074LKI9_9BACL|nr:hypothetical protein [Tumebacillus flagellatus]KEO82636.1 hypothetical protein EL26_13790 [Tumebacillus flagellatus]